MSKSKGRLCENQPTIDGFSRSIMSGRTYKKHCPDRRTAI